MDKKTSAVQNIIQSFPKDENEDDEKVHVSGARAVWSYEVYQKKPGSVQNDSVPAFEELGLSDASLSIVRTNVCEGVEKLAGRNSFRVWISDILNPQLNNAVRTHPEGSPWILQILFFGEEHIAFILTLFPCDAPASEEQTATMRGFSRTTARMLMASLMNFCHTEFFLVPAALAYSGTFDVERLQRDLEQQMSSASEIYGGPAKLSKPAYHELTQAMNYVMRSTSVPCALQLSSVKKTEYWLLLMDADWHKAVIHLLNMLEGILKHQITEPCHLTYELEKRTKMLIAVLEVARRLSFQHKVLVVSQDEELRVPIEKVAAELERNHGLEHWLSFESQQSFRARTNEPEDIVIAWDAPELRTHSGVVLTVTKVSSMHSRLYSTLPEGQTVQLEKLRLLLVGVAGAGRSATANTLLGKKAFKTGPSFNIITEVCETHKNVNEGTLIEVTEVPGLLTKVPFRTLYSKTQSWTYDAVCYVIKIDRFTSKDKRAFQNLKTALGANVVRHIIVIFTCGEKLNSDTKIEEENPTPELKELLGECGQRYVVFTNNSEDKAAQTKRFLKVLEDLKNFLDDENKTFTCPWEGRQPAIA